MGIELKRHQTIQLPFAKHCWSIRCCKLTKEERCNTYDRPHPSSHQPTLLHPGFPCPTREQPCNAYDRTQGDELQVVGKAQTMFPRPPPSPGKHNRNPSLCREGYLSATGEEEKPQVLFKPQTYLSFPGKTAPLLGKHNRNPSNCWEDYLSTRGKLIGTCWSLRWHMFTFD